MPRPRKPEADRLVPVSTSLPAAKFDELDKLARARRVSMSTLIRTLIVGGFRKCKTPDVAVQP